MLALVAFGASLLTFFSGFGLGTLLLPVFAVFFPVDIAIALTGLVHFLNNIFKLILIGRHAERHIVLDFGIPSVGGAFAGAWFLLYLSDIEPLATYILGGHIFYVTPVKLIIAILMAVFALFEIVPSLTKLQAAPRYLPLGGLISGFFGGLSGHQGALRSAFLMRCNLGKETFIATGVFVACFVDITRLAVYSRHGFGEGIEANAGLLACSVLAAFAGAWLGSRLLNKITLGALHTSVAVAILLMALALGAGWI